MSNLPTILVTILLLLLTTNTQAEVQSLTFIDAALDTVFSPITNTQTYVRSSLPSSISIRADVSDPSLTSNVQFFNDVTGALIRKEGIAPYAINGDNPAGNYKAWALPSGLNRLKIVETLKAGGVNQLIVEFTISDAVVTVTPTPTMGVTVIPSMSAGVSVSASPSMSVGVTPTPTSSQVIGGSSIALFLVDTGATPDVDAFEIADGGVYDKTSLPSLLSIRADIVKVGTTTNSVKFFVNGAQIRQENVSPYAINGDSGALNLKPWSGLPDGAVELKAEQIVGGTVVESKTVTFTVTDGPPTVTPSMTMGITVSPTPTMTAGASVTPTVSPGTVSPTVSPTMTVSAGPTISGTVSPTLTKKINFGRPVPVDGFESDADIVFTGAPKNSIETSDIAGTDLDLVYNSHKWGANFGFSVPVADSAPQTVILGFAETYTPACNVGSRVFSVTVGTETVSDIDVFAEAGCNALYNIQVDNVVPNAEGLIVVSLVSTVQNAYIASIQIGSDGLPVTFTPSATPTPGISTVSPTPTATVGVTATANPTVSGPPINTAEARINFGSSAVDGFLSDTGVNIIGGTGTYVQGRPITGTSFQQVYQSHRSASTFSFTLPVDGPKDIVLGFAEIYVPNCATGKRVFSATVGTETVSDIDVFDSVGCDAAYNIEFDNITPNADGLIEVTLVASVQQAFISAVQVLPANSPAATESPSPMPTFSGESRWAIFATNGDPTKRHEACFVRGDDGKGYLVGGRGLKPVNVFDPATNTWTQKAGPGMELHHMQCLAYDNKIWIGSSWTGSFPNELNTEFMYIYDTVADSWSTKPGLPEPRRRGGGAFVLHEGKMWLAMGNRGGHGAQATSYGWLDMFDPEANGGEGAWSPVLYPDAPDARDHTSGAIVNGNKFCVGGGRDGGSSGFFNNPILPVNCYTFATNEWERGPDIPQGRAGAAAGTTCDGEMMIAGGEGFGQAFSDVSIFDGTSWRVAAPLERARHGSGLLVSADCTCKKIYIASGSGNQGGGPELTSTEVYLDMGDATPVCAA